MENPQGAIFKNVVLTTSGFPQNVKAEYKAKTLALGGEFQAHYDPELCTHLIAATVGSAKYVAAKEHGTPVVAPAWISKCYRERKLVPIDDYILGAFSGFCISVTGMQEGGLRERLISIIEKNGGAYSGLLHMENTTHLIANEPSGTKFQAAVEWGLKVVKPEWIEECGRRSRWLDERDYLLTDEDGIDLEKRKQQELQEREKELEAQKLAAEKEKKLKLEQLKKEEEQKEKDLLQNLRDTGKVLDVCDDAQIFLHGFDTARKRVYAYLVRLSGATLFCQWSPSVSHVLVGDGPCASYLRQIKTESNGITMLNPSWLVDSLRKQQSMQTKDYNYEIPMSSPIAVQRLLTRTKSLSGREKSNALNRNKRKYEKSNSGKASFTKMKKKQKTQPLSGCLVCVSNYSGEEREMVRTLSIELGANYTDRLTRKDPAVTHLITNSLQGQKVLKARQWGNIQIEGIEWLLNLRNANTS